MTLPFKEIPHRLYKNTFLQNVFVSYTFQSDEGMVDSPAIKDEFDNFICSQFGLEPNDSFPAEPISLSSSDKMISFLFLGIRLLLELELETIDHLKTVLFRRS